MKKIGLWVALALACSAPLAAEQAGHTVYTQSSEKSTKMRIGYTDGNMALNLGLGFDVIMEGAIQFPSDYMSRLKGNKITAVRLAVGDALSAHEKYVFIARALDGSFLYKQPVSELVSGWNEIRLDQPFEITGEELFIGFKYSSAGEPFSMDGREKNDLANWIRLTQNDESSDIAWQHQDGGCLNLQAIVEGETLPQNDIAVQNVLAKRYAQTGGKAPLSLIVRNMAAADIHSLEVTYTVEDQEPVTCLVEHLDIASDEVAKVKVADVEFGSNGIYNLDVQVDKVNGEEDENPNDNKGLVENIISKKDYTNRKVLLEHFSTMRCNNCPTAHKTIDDALTYREDVIHVVHHAGMGKDPLTIPESEAYLFFYRDEVSGSIYAPGAMLDRTNLAPYGADDGTNSTPAPVFFPQRSSFGKLVDQRLSTQALVTLDIEKQYDEASRALSVKVSGMIPSGNPERLDGSNICLNIFLTEDSILCDYPQAGAEDPKTYYHSNVLRKVLTDVWGDPVTFDGDSYLSREYTCVIPQEWVSKQMHIVAFLANSDRAHSNNCPVYNANVLALAGDDNSTGICPQEVTDGPLTGCFVHNGQLVVFGEYSRAAIYDASGNCLRQIEAYRKSVPVDGLPQGVYFIRLETVQGAHICKFII